MSRKQTVRLVKDKLEIRLTEAKRRLDAAGNEAQALVDEYHCNYSRALEFAMIDRELVERERTWHKRYVHEGCCESCGGPNVWNVGKKGDADPIDSRYCSACQEEHGTECCVVCGALELSSEMVDDECGNCHDEFGYKVNAPDRFDDEN